MSLKNTEGIKWTVRSFYALAVIGAMLLVGCGSAEEATQQDTQQSQGGGTVQEAPKAEQPMDQALTNFIGQKEPEPVQQPAKVETPPTAKAPDLDKQVDDLRTENTILKQKIVKLEQDNRTLNARVAEDDARITAEKDRADKAEAALKNAPPVVTKVPVSSGSVMTSYEEALKSFNSRRYDDALSEFKALQTSGVSDDLADNCTYWVGESYYAKKKYRDALASFQEVMKFKVSEKKGDALFMSAQCYERLGEKVKAKAAYEKVVKDYPMSRNLKRAKERWARL